MKLYHHITSHSFDVQSYMNCKYPENREYGRIELTRSNEPSLSDVVSYRRDSREAITACDAVSPNDKRRDASSSSSSDATESTLLSSSCACRSTSVGALNSVMDGVVVPRSAVEERGEALLPSDVNGGTFSAQEEMGEDILDSERVCVRESGGTATDQAQCQISEKIDGCSWGSMLTGCSFVFHHQCPWETAERIRCRS